METMGDADELGYGEEPPTSRSRFATTESLAVGSLALAVCAFFAVGTFQFLFFLIGNSEQSETEQYLIIASPTGLFGALAVALGLTATRRGDGDRWTAGVAGAGVIVGGVGLLITLVGVVLAVALGDPAEPGF